MNLEKAKTIFIVGNKVYNGFTKEEGIITKVRKNYIDPTSLSVVEVIQRKNNVRRCWNSNDVLPFTIGDIVQVKSNNLTIHYGKIIEIKELSYKCYWTFNKPETITNWEELTIGSSLEYKRFPATLYGQPILKDENKCICDNMELMWKGCTCGFLRKQGE